MRILAALCALPAAFLYFAGAAVFLLAALPLEVCGHVLVKAADLLGVISIRLSHHIDRKKGP